MKNKKSIFITAVIGFSLILISLFVYWKLFFSRYIEETVLADNIQISSETKEINIENLVKIEKEINYLSVLLEPSYKAVNDNEVKGIKTPSGEIINPEIKIIDEDAKEYLLTYSGSRNFENNEYANYRAAEELSVYKRYEKMLIRSNTPMKVQKIIWNSYNAEDLK